MEEPQSMSESSPFATRMRTHTCGELRAAHIGETVTIAGSVWANIKEGILDLRDGFGITRVELTEEGLALLERQLETRTPTPESFFAMEGEVVARETPDGDNPTGAVMVRCPGPDLLSIANAPLLFDYRDPEIKRWDRIRYRYISLRNPEVHAVFAFRTRLLRALRQHLNREDFVEVETPILASRFRREAPESFIAIRDVRQIFALPGKRPIHPSVLMASGFDRVFEVARRFNRKVEYGPYQQPEFSVLDISMAYVDSADLLTAADALLDGIWRRFLKQEGALPLTEMTYHEAMVRYGTTSPDLRIPLTLTDVSEIGRQSRLPALRDGLEEGGAMRALRIPGRGGDVSALDDLDTLVETPGLTDVFYFQIEEGGSFSPRGTGKIDGFTAMSIVKALKAEVGDIVLIAFAVTTSACDSLAGRMRAFAGAQLDLVEDVLRFARVTELPYYREDAITGDVNLVGDVTTQPTPEDLNKDVTVMRSQGFLLSLSGVNIGGGGIKHHDLSRFRSLLKGFGYGPIEVDERFGILLDVLQYGVPPHGRVAIGIDRLVALLLGLSSIDEVMPLPKIYDGSDPLVRSPWPMSRALVKGLLGV